MIPHSSSHLHLKHSSLQISQGRDCPHELYDSLWLQEASEEPRSFGALTAGGMGSPFDIPLHRHASSVQPLGSRWKRSFPGRVSVRMNSDCVVVLGRGTTDSQHRNYSRHKEKHQQRSYSTKRVRNFIEEEENRDFKSCFDFILQLCTWTVKHQKR